MFYLDLEKKDGSICTVSFKENQSSLGQKWAAALREIIDRNNPVAQPDRIYNLNDEWNEAKIINKINECINTINQYIPGTIDFSLTETMTQADSNKLHHYFEIIRGENDQPNQFYIDSPENVKHAIEYYNILIHRWEYLGAPRRIVVHFSEREMFDMELDDYDCWTMNWRAGDVRINYCHKGKPIYDFFKDNDEEIGDDNITPQTRYSADFCINFNAGPGYPDRYYELWEEHKDFLGNLGYTIDDPRSAVGQGIIGRIVGNPFVVREQVRGSVKILGARYDET